MNENLYNSKILQLLVVFINKNGKKQLAQNIVFRTMYEIENSTASNPLLILNNAIFNITPTIGVKKKRVRGPVIQVPIEIDPIKGRSIAIKWLLLNAKKRSELTFYKRLAKEILDANNNMGQSIKKREELQKTAEANRVFAHM